MTDDTQRILGQHGAVIASMQNDLLELKSDVKVIRETLAEARGGWKTLMLISGASGTIGAGVGWIASFLHLKLPPQ